MASPFKKKSPLNAYKYSLTSKYADPTQVVQPLVGNEITKKIGEEAKNVSNSYKKAHSDKLAKKALDEAGNLKHQRAMEVKWGKGNTGPAVKPASHEENMSNFGLTSFKDVQAERDAKDFMNRDFGGNKDPNSLVNIGRAGRTSNSSQGSKENKVPPSKAGLGKVKFQVTTSTRRFGAMEGSPNKLIGDTMDPYGQPQRGIRDFTFNENKIAPGTLGNQASMGVQKEIYGGGQAQVAAEQLAAEQLQAPLLSKGHADDYEGHTHRKKGKSYEVGEYIDETDFESLNTSLNAYDRGEIQKDKKSQFIVTKNEDYNPTQIDTIRPSKGKEFKMGWGDAERNISTNPKYKKSK